jgi:hypothetical protein
MTFKNFLEDAGTPPEDWPKAYLLRKDYTKPHGPGNFYWSKDRVGAVRMQQDVNDRTVVWEGKPTSLAALCKEHGTNLNLAKRRLDLGWTVFRAVVKEPDEKKKAVITYKGQKYTLRQAARVSGLPLGTIRTRFYRRWPGHEIMELPQSKDPYRRKRKENGLKQETQTASNHQPSGGVLLLPRSDGGRPPDPHSDVRADDSSGESLHEESA